MSCIEPFGLNLAKAIQSTFTASQCFRWTGLLKIIRHTKGDFIDIYFILDQSRSTGAFTDIKPVHIRSYDPHNSQTKQLIYKYDQIIDIISKTNPIYKDIRISIHGDKLNSKTSTCDVGLFRIYTGEVYVSHGQSRIRTRLVKPSLDISKAIAEKYSKSDSLTRAEIYKVNAVVRIGIRSKASDVIARFARSVLNKAFQREFMLS
jgi:hypothetical protein